MGWIEWVLSSEFRRFLLDHDLFFPLFFLGRLIGITVVELWHPAPGTRGVLSQGDPERFGGFCRFSVCCFSTGRTN